MVVNSDGVDSVALVGRASHLQRMDKVLADARSGSAGAVIVWGEPGIGKTRLVSEWCERAVAAGSEVLAGRGSESEQEVPFGMVVQALDERFAALDSQVVAKVGPNRMAELAAVLPSLSRGGGQSARRLEVERFEFHRAVRFAFDQLARRKPIVLALDDVHWADPASVELIGHLLRHSVPGLVLVLAYRPRQAPRLLVDAVLQAARESSVCELELAPLTLAEAAEALGARPDSALAGALHFESGGNPFYLEQLARSSGKLLPIPRAGGAAGKEAGISVALRMTITNELSGLVSDTLRVLQAGAVAGDPFDLDLVTAIVESEQHRVLRSLDELVAVDLVRPTKTPGRFRFRYPIVRRVVYDEAMPGWRYSAHKQAAEALGRRGASVGTRALVE
ncbi:AAA family ATPase [Nocardia sp. NPDC049190]|uniref:ATP-binding protein n=1 Tax=Nocardia sp. NPDC049190 TaxID=3155650 RepID=UPI0033E1FDFB